MQPRGVSRGSPRTPGRSILLVRGGGRRERCPVVSSIRIGLGYLFPPRLVVDTGVIIDRLDAVYALGTATPPPRPAHDRALQLFGSLTARESLGLVTSVSVQEVFPVLLRRRLHSEIPNHLADLADLAARFPSIRSPKNCRWRHLFEAWSDLLRFFADGFAETRLVMIASGPVVLRPTDLGPIPSGATLAEALLDLVARHHLDTGDAAILLEAQRAGVTAIVTSAADLHRAQVDFDGYAWL